MKVIHPVGMRLSLSAESRIVLCLQVNHILHVLALLLDALIHC